MFSHVRSGRDLLHPHHDSGIPDDPTPADQAIYVPSVSPNYSMDVAAAIEKGGWKRPLSAGITPREMSFLGTDTKKEFTLSHALYSAGQALDKHGPCMIRDRKPGFSRVIGDSGGFQIANQKEGEERINGYRDRERILRWLENVADIAMTLDIPPGPVGRSQNFRYTHVDHCLTETLDHLTFFRDNRRNTDLKLLNVLQGNDLTHGLHWYDQVKRFQFEGYAIAGLCRNDMWYVCNLLIRMLDEGKLQTAEWLHVLGTARLDTAVMLTAIQRALAAQGLKVRISYDTASPSLMMARNRAYTFPQFGAKRMVYTAVPAPKGARYYDSKALWPWPSPIGNRMLMGDLCVEETTGHRNDSQRDALGNHLLTLHNLQSVCFAVNTANRVMDTELISGQHSVGEIEGKAVVAIQEIFKAGTVDAIHRHRDTFMELRGTAGDGLEDFSEEELRNP